MIFKGEMYSPLSQLCPSQPSAQMHWYALILSMQVPPLRQGLLSQSLMSESKGWENRCWKVWEALNLTTAKDTGIGIRLTLMAVRAGESLLTLAAEVPSGVTSTAAVRTTNVRGDEPHAARSTVRRHGNRAAVNHCGKTWGLSHQESFI